MNTSLRSGWSVVGVIFFALGAVACTAGQEEDVGSSNEALREDPRRQEQARSSSSGRAADPRAAEETPRLTREGADDDAPRSGDEAPRPDQDDPSRPADDGSRPPEPPRR